MLRELSLVFLLLPAEIEPGREIVRAVELPADAQALDGHGSSITLELEPSAAGKLHVWAPTAGFRPFLRIEDVRGSLLVESRPDWSTSCCVLSVVAGDRLLLRVASQAPGQGGALELHLFLTRESERSRSLVEEAERELDALEASSGESGEQVRARIDRLVRRLLDDPDADASLDISQVLWRTAAAALPRAHPEAERLALECVLAFRRRAFPPDHPAITVTQGALALALFRLGGLGRARELQESVLAVRERDLPAGHWLVVDARQRLSDTLLALGEIEAANGLALAVYQELSEQLDGRDERFLAARGNLSLTLRRMGRLHEARALSEAVLDTYLELRPEDHPDVQHARLNLGLILQDLGDFAAASELLWRSYEVQKESGRASDISLLKSGSALANALFAARRREESAALDEDLLATYSEILPADFPDLLLLRANLAHRALTLGDLESARARFEELLPDLPENDLFTPSLRGRAADLYAALGDTAKAQELYERAMAGLTRLVPEDHPRRVALLNDFFYFQMNTGETERGAELAHELAQLLSRSARNAAISLPPRRAEAWASGHEIAIGNVLTHTCPGWPLESSASLAAECFALVESLRGLALVGSRVLSAARADEELARLRDSLRGASAEVVVLAGRPDLPEAVRRKEAVQAALFDHLAAGPANALVVEPTVAKLAAALARGAAAIGFRVYRRGVRKGPSEPWLLAHVIRPGRPLVRIDLGPEAQIAEAVAAWRGAIGVSSDARGVEPKSAANGDERATGEALRALVLDPLSEALGEATILVVALDGALHAVPLDALPDGEQGVVGDRLQVQVRSTLSELLVPAPPSEDGVLLALGGVDYDGAGESALSGSVLDGAPLAVVRGGRESFAPLPGTREEALEIVARYRNTFGEARPARILSGREASRRALASLAPGARFLHLATHGFAAPATSAPSSGRAAFAGDEPDEARVLALSPMVLCGLALAGANLPGDELGLVRGVITAEELAAFDLSACELAVLSACDTNVGFASRGQGVASLQKALHLAGARSAITSLWRVDDAATRRLMVLFYASLWDEGLGKADALWRAKTTLRREGRPTRDWAAWVLSGEPR